MTSQHSHGWWTRDNAARRSLSLSIGLSRMGPEIQWDPSDGSVPGSGLTEEEPPS